MLNKLTIDIEVTDAELRFLKENGGILRCVRELITAAAEEVNYHQLANRVGGNQLVRTRATRRNPYPSAYVLGKLVRVSPLTTDYRTPDGLVVTEETRNIELAE